MRCPFCSHIDTQVKDSRATEDGTAIRRRRICSGCGSRFTTFERIQLREVNVIKSNGDEKPFDRDKLTRSIQLACRKRPITPERIDQMVTGIQRYLETSGENAVPSSFIGQLVMEALETLDPVAYIRFASVYKNFQNSADFKKILENVPVNKKSSDELF